VENSSVPWCSSHPFIIRWALPEIFKSPMAMSQVRFFRAGTPMAFSAAITGESTAS
jgi:hypothetical protein